MAVSQSQGEGKRTSSARVVQRSRKGLAIAAACMLYSRIEKMKQESWIPDSFKNLFNDELMENIASDILHAKGHKKLQCVLKIERKNEATGELELVDNPECKFHPKLEKFKISLLSADAKPKIPVTMVFIVVV